MKKKLMTLILLMVLTTTSVTPPVFAVEENGYSKSGVADEKKEEIKKD